MSRLAEVLANVLVLDDRARRALDEAVADWRLEASAAHDPFARVWRHVSGAAAITRVVALTSFRDAIRVDTFSDVGIGLTWAIAWGMFLASIATTRLWVSNSPLLTPLWFEAIALGNALVLFPLCVSGFATRAPRRGSIAGVSIASMALMLLLAGWISPDLNQRFRQEAFSSAMPSASLNGREVVRGLNETRLPALVSAAFSAYDGERSNAVPQLSQRLAMVAAAPMLLLLGAQWRSQSRARRFARMAFAWYCYPIVIFLGGRTWTLFVPWLALALVGAVAVKMAARTRTPEPSELRNPGP